MGKLIWSNSTYTQDSDSKMVFDFEMMTLRLELENAAAENHSIQIDLFDSAGKSNEYKFKVKLLSTRDSEISEQEALDNKDYTTV